MEEKVIRRSKIYTYFYGRNTVFQKFLILVGALALILSGVAKNANAKNYSKKLEEKRVTYQAAEQAYENEYDNLRLELGVRVYYGQEAYIEPEDEYKTEKTKYNEKLEAYKEARENYNEFRSNGPNKGFFGGLCTLAGIAGLVVGFGWILYKKWSRNYVGQAEYDAELAERAEFAKKRGLEKLNIVAEQIDSVEPVVLTGVAEAEAAVESVNAIARFFSKALQLILSLDNIVLGAIAIAIYTAIVSAIAQGMGAFIFFFLVTAGGMGYYGMYLYKKYETNSFVPEKVFQKMDRFTPASLTKLGDDDKIRVSLPAVTVYMFGQEQLYAYTYSFDIVTGDVINEETHEYFYDDIVGVISDQTVKKLTIGEGFLRLSLRTIRYQKESITIATSGGAHKEAYLLDMGQSLLDTKFLGMRNLIRQKKNEQ